jgi:regulator of cell morphogenesis and NO signaling
MKDALMNFEKIFIMKPLPQQTLATIVTNDHRAASILEKYDLDFCCKGKRTLEAACDEKGLSAENISTEILSSTTTNATNAISFRSMSPDQLIGYIMLTHHFFVKQQMPQIHMHLEKVASKHGDRFPYMKEVFQLFGEVCMEMTTHIQKEEAVLFPAIKQAADSFIGKGEGGNSFKIIEFAVDVMESEHEIAGDLMAKIRKLTNNYEAPAGACTTFQLTLAELEAFEKDLHQHVHLENNILFPMAKGYTASQSCCCAI